MQAHSRSSAPRNYVPRCDRWLKESCSKVFDLMDCRAALDFCLAEIVDPYIAAGHNPYDMTTPCEGGHMDALCYPITKCPVPSALLIRYSDVMCLFRWIEEYLNRPDVRSTLGVDPAIGNYTFLSPKVQTAFLATLDELSTPAQYYLAGLLERGVRALIYAGADDYICNWVGNERMTLELEWTEQERFKAQPLRSWNISGKPAGLTRSAGPFTFATIFGAGHMAPYNAPAESLELNSYIGGRSTIVYPYDNSNLEPVELGASIFVKANENLWRATDEFELDRIDFGDDDNVMGIWDGANFVLTTGGGSFYSGWWDTLKIIWRYGYRAPQRTQAITISYSVLASAPRFSNVTTLASTLGWTELIVQTTSEYFDLQGVDRRFSRELVEAATRVNYGQNSDEILLWKASARSRLRAQRVSKAATSRYLRTSWCTRTQQCISIPQLTLLASVAFWTVAASYIPITRTSLPWCHSGRALPLFLDYIFSFGASIAPIPEQPYVRLHVTLLSTTASTPHASYFGLKHGTKAPTEVLTTWEGVRTGGEHEPEFNSLTYHGPEWVVKIFSKERVSDEWLAKVFDGQVGWVYRKEWDAYPVLPPTTDFPPVKLADGLYYVNAFEPFISTMETETIASRNAVDLLLQEQFDAGICGKSTVGDDDGDASSENESSHEKDGKDFVLGWDC
ncbi:hypothetical protein A0H81_01708 [Grifola frondosa]|uniref:Prenylcysteine lyase domain-containing protein n=1 Tax=Grifola frondosa TaxID=5627 RepID=A0A1C7MKW2_GRIFR|nr:hypothetical protein A0H81_01708 [Grifola frondosa]